MQITINLKGVDIVRQGLQNLASEIPQVGRRQIYDNMNLITRDMEAYPEERPGQKYIRTGRLGFSWYIKNVDQGYMVYNPTPYGKYVVGNAYGQGQAWMHEGRWQLFRDVVEHNVSKLAQEIRDAIMLVARRNNLTK
jgi:hypothetical protein